MSSLIASPRWRPEDLGQPLPHSQHAVSTAMPQWSDVIGYEEGAPQVMDALSCGYPRFFLHPLVAELLVKHHFSVFCSLPFPSKGAASRALVFVFQQSGLSGTIKPLDYERIHVVAVPEAAYPALWAYWQHSGEIVSSRLAQAVLEERPLIEGHDEARDEIIRRLAQFSSAQPEDILLFPTGMAAIALAHRAASALFPDRADVQFGFSYVDTLKLLEKMEPGAIFLASGDGEALSQLAARIDCNPPAAVFCECPSNPLMVLPDLKALSLLLRPRRIPLIVDNTFDSFYQIKVFPYADLVVTSLTKYFSGVGDVMGGSLVFNAGSPLYSELRQSCAAHYEDLLFAGDATVLAHNSRGFQSRMARVDATTSALVEHLEAHPAVARLYRPGNAEAGSYLLPNAETRFGGLFSIELKNAAAVTPGFYDRLRLCKGPSLGTEFTLVCPYTMLAHYNELEWAAQLGISAHLIRVSVGLEPLDELITRFDEALA